MRILTSRCIVYFFPMNTSWLCKWIACLLLISGFSGCTNFPFPTVALGPDQQKVKVVTQELSGNTALVSVFKYDNTKRLRSIITYQTPDSTIAPVESSLYEYDSLNRLLRLKHDVIRRDNLGTMSQIYTYSYDQTGEPAEIKYTKTDGMGGLWSVGLVYGSSRQLVEDIEPSSLSDFTTQESSTFTFMGSHLTLSKKVNYMSEKSDSTNAIDSNIKPFYGRFVIPAHFNLPMYPVRLPSITHTPTLV